MSGVAPSRGPPPNNVMQSEPHKAQALDGPRISDGATQGSSSSTKPI